MAKKPLKDYNSGSRESIVQYVKGKGLWFDYFEVLYTKDGSMDKERLY